jgi:hypothetical protein
MEKVEIVDDEKVEVEEKPEQEVEDDDNLKALKFIWQNIEAAQSRTGVLSLENCEQVLNSYNLLLSFFKALNVSTNTKAKEEGNTVTANQLIFNAYNTILSGVEMQNAKGIFVISGAVEILKQLRLLKASLDAVKDPAIELKELKSQSKIVKDKADKPKKKNK